MNLVLLLVAAAIPLLLIYPVSSMSQTVTEDGAGVGEIPGGLVPENNTVGPVGSTGAEYKFDHGFYQKIQSLTPEDPEEGGYGVHDGKRYYDVLIVVSRDDGDDRSADETARENKDAVVKRLGLVGARNIASAESLSFVTASVPVADIPGFSLHDEVYAIGDGELPVTPDIDKARETIHATTNELRRAAGILPNGAGVTVGIVDTGINSVYLNSKVSERIYCPGNTCSVVNRNLVGSFIPGMSGLDNLNDTYASHGTVVAHVIAASGAPNNAGIASGVTLLDARYGDGGNGNFTYSNNFITALAHSVDWSYSRGADVVNISAGTGNCSDTDTTTYSHILNEAVDKGMVVVKSAGNNGEDSAGNPRYQSINNPGCSHNVITVGGIDDRVGAIEMANFSSRGPTDNSQPRLLPHIVAPAHEIKMPYLTYHPALHIWNGTSFAVPQVSAAAAMMLQVEPELTPAEVKAALLLGADWQGPVPCTSAQYEQNRPTDNCSYAKQPTTSLEANNAASLGILNNAGFGILDAAQSVKYVKSLTSYVVSDNLTPSSTTKLYRFTVTDASEPVKVILTWLSQPHGGIEEQVNRSKSVHIANLDLGVTAPNRVTTWSNSTHQTTEFIMFDPTRTGTYTVTVSGSGSDIKLLNKPVQAFALASTNPLSEVSSSSTTITNHAPTAQPRTLIVSPGMEKVVRLHSIDLDSDVVSFHVSQKPSRGVVTTDEMITESVSRVVYTPNADLAATDTFRVTPHDGKTQGAAATITLRPESLPSGSSPANPSSDNVRDWDTLEVTSGYAHTSYSQTFAGRTYAVSAIHIGSVNMEGVDLSITTTSGRTYTAAIPPSGARMIEFQSPITIRSATLSADGIDEEAAHDITKYLEKQRPSRYTSTFGDVRMFVGYVPSACSSGSSGAAGSSGASCPAHTTYVAATRPNLGIPDNTDMQNTTSTIGMPINGTIVSLSATVDITHPHIGDLKVVLTPPSGNQAVLHSRTGGGTDNISTTYSSSTHTGLRSLHGAQINGNWTLSVGDYVGGDVGTLNGWTLTITYTPTPSAPTSPTQPSSNTTVFMDDFESSSFTAKWTESGEGDWRLSTSRVHGVPTAPGHASTNKVMHVDNCDTTCTLTLKNALDLSGYDSATLSFLRFIDYGLDSGEYLKVELYDGTSWNQVYRWTHGSGDDNRWHTESYDLSSYLVSGFKMRFVAHMSSSSEDVQLDDVVINATSRGSGSPTPTPTPSDYSVYVADTDDREVLVFSKNGTYLDRFVDSRAGGLGKAWDLAFGPDGHLYVSDNTYNKIRKYNGATGAPIGSSTAGWASTTGFPNGLAWEGNALYVATSRGVEKFSSSGSSLGYFGDAHRSPATTGATALVSPQDVVFCSDNRMYVSDKSLGKVLYYKTSDGKYLGAISGTASSPPNTRVATGLECGSAMIGSGTSLYQSGDDGGRINEINPSTGSLVRSITSLIDEPYCMDMDSSGVLYVANKDDNNIVKVTSAQSSVFASGNSMDDPRGVTVGPVYSAGSSSQDSSSQSEEAQDVQNDEPEFVLMYNGTTTYGPITLAAHTASFIVQATDPEGDAITIGIIPDHLLPDGAMSVTDHQNGTATVTVSSANATAGTYALWVEVSDAKGNHDRQPYAVIVP